MIVIYVVKAEIHTGRAVISCIFDPWLHEPGSERFRLFGTGNVVW